MATFTFEPASDAEDTLTYDQVADTDGLYGSGSDAPAVLSLRGSVFSLDPATGEIGAEIDPTDARLFRKLRGKITVTLVS